MDKKGLSPIIATVLLISLVLVLASIIFLWARAFIPEKLQKFDSPIENACASVSFEAAYSAGKVTVQNNGNVPLYSIRVGVKKFGSLDYIDVTPSTVVAGGSYPYDVGDVTGELVVIPVLLGKTSGGERKAFACGEENAKIIQA